MAEGAADPNVSDVDEDFAWGFRVHGGARLRTKAHSVRHVGGGGNVEIEKARPG